MKFKALMVLVVFALTMLFSCANEEGKSFQELAVEKAVETYIETFLGGLDTEDVKTLLAERKADLVSKALYNYANVSEIQDLGMNDKAKQAVLLAVQDITGKPVELQ